MDFFLVDLICGAVGRIVLFLRYWNYQKMKNHLVLNDYCSYSDFTKYHIIRSFGFIFLMIIGISLLTILYVAIRHIFKLL